MDKKIQEFKEKVKKYRSRMMELIKNIWQKTISPKFKFVLLPLKWIWQRIGCRELSIITWAIFICFLLLLLPCFPLKNNATTDAKIGNIIMYLGSTLTVYAIFINIAWNRYSARDNLIADLTNTAMHQLRRFKNASLANEARMMEILPMPSLLNIWGIIRYKSHNNIKANTDYGLTKCNNQWIAKIHEYEGEWHNKKKIDKVKIDLSKADEWNEVYKKLNIRPETVSSIRSFVESMKQDLSGFNLTLIWLQGANLQEANLRWAKLWGAKLQGAMLRWADLRGANLEGAKLQGAMLREAKLQGAILRWADLRGADLQWADLEGADLRWAKLQGADLRGAKLEGASLNGASFLDAKNIDQAGFHEVKNIEYAVFNDRETKERIITKFNITHDPEKLKKAEAPGGYCEDVRERKRKRAEEEKAQSGKPD